MANGPFPYVLDAYFIRNLIDYKKLDTKKLG